MQAFWGSFRFPADVCQVTSRRIPVLAPGTQRPIRTRVLTSVRAIISVDGSDEASLAQAEIIDALLTPYQDFVLYTNTGRPSAEQNTTSGSLTGCTLVSGPDFTETSEGEWCTVRTVNFTLSSEYLVTGAETAIVAWQESFTRIGNGGPDRRWRFPVNQPGGILQTYTPSSLVRVIQAGQAVGHLTYPPVPPGRWGLGVGRIVLSNADETVRFGTAERMGKILVNWPVSWQYIYESDGPFMGLPTQPPL